MLLDVLALLDSIDDVDAPSKKRRSTLVLRERRPFTTYIRPMLQDHTFSMRFSGTLLCVLARVFSCVSRERWRYQCLL